MPRDDVLDDDRDGRSADYAARVVADPEFYATQVRLTLEHPQVRVRRLEVLLDFDDALAEAFMRERPGLDPRSPSSRPTSRPTSSRRRWRAGCSQALRRTARTGSRAWPHMRSTVEHLLGRTVIASLAREPSAARPMTDL